MKLQIRPGRILNFDIENRPLTYLGDDFTFGEITAIAWKFVGVGRYEVRLLGVDDPVDILSDFVDAYDMADIVSGHYIRIHDLPSVNGALLEYGLPALSPKLTSDTHLDLLKIKNVSKSQENLAAMLGVRSPKVGMSQQRWRQANRLTPEGVALTRRRVVGDVRQHIALRAVLLKNGWLGPPKLWTPAKGVLK